MKPLYKLLESYDACQSAVEWAKPYNKAYAKAWKECKRGDWMLWIAGKLGVPQKKLVMVACDCARLSLQYVPEGELRPLKAIQTAEAWCHGKATKQQCKTAASAAADAANAAADAAYAADATANAYANAVVIKVIQTLLPFSMLRLKLKAVV